MDARLAAFESELEFLGPQLELTDQRLLDVEQQRTAVGNLVHRVRRIENSMVSTVVSDAQAGLPISIMTLRMLQGSDDAINNHEDRLNRHAICLDRLDRIAAAHPPVTADIVNGLRCEVDRLESNTMSKNARSNT